MVSLILSSTQQPTLTDDLITITTPTQLNHFKDGLFDAITVDQVIDLKTMIQISRVLKYNGTLNAQETLPLLIAAAGFQQVEPNVYQKLQLKVISLNKELPIIEEIQNCFGIYDYITQRYINNAFKSIQQSQTLQQAETIDEDELLNDGVVAKQVESCATKPRACANCTCGRKEQEDAQDKEQLEQQLSSGQVQSSCGSCYLGDAFRCANCPYRGLPAFKQGEIIQVKQDDQFAEEAEKPEVVTQEGKVKLQL